MGPNPGPVESLNDFSPNFVSLNDCSLEPLALQAQQYGKYTPELATSWALGPGTVTIHLRQDATWQNGTPVTSKDLTTSLLLEGIDGSGIWSAITGDHTTNSKTLMLDVRKGVSPARVLYDVLTMYPVSAQRYGKFVAGPGLKQDLLSYASLVATNPTAAATSSSEKAISAALSALTKYNPKTYLGDGPFQFVNMTTQEIVLKKWDGFWAARHIHVPGIVSTNLGTNSAIWEAMIAGPGDITQVGITNLIIKKMRSTPGLHVAVEPYGFLFGLFFNDQKNPYNQVNVRRALAYVIDRPKVASSITGGNASLYPPTSYPTGVTDAALHATVPSNLIRSLNPYHHDPAKAAAMLRKGGFHKRHHEWFLPDGKQFTMTIDTIAGESDTIEFAVSTASELTNFGIKASATAVESTSDFTNLEKGDFTASTVWIDGPQPMSTLGAEFDTYDYSSVGSGYGFGPIKVVPGLGRVNIPKAVAAEQSTLGPASKQLDSDLFIWARYVNKEIPFLTVTGRDIFIPYSTSQFADWPPIGNSLWKLEGVDATGTLMTMFEEGYVRPKH